MDWISVIVAVLILTGIVVLYKKSRQARQLQYIKTFRFNSAIREKLGKKYPHLGAEQMHLVFQALRDYFWICNSAKRKMVSMPSQVVDEAWHEFILFTRSYKTFCRKGIGRFLHHTPATAMKSPTLAEDGIKRTWRLACAKENINPRSPDKLPLLFAIDAMLAIPDGFNYSPNCKDKTSPTYGDGYCAGHIGCSSGCAGDSGTHDSSGGFFDGFFDSSDGGSGCGGGGCGGGD